MTLGAKIRDARTTAGMTQAELAQAIAIGIQQVQRYENGTARIAVDTLQKLGDALGVHPGSFLDGPVPASLARLPSAREVTRAATTLYQIRDLETRRQTMALIEALAKAETVRP